MFKALSDVKLKAEVKPTVDNIMCRLHYRYTYLQYMVFVLLCTLYDAIGEKIQCLVDIDSDSYADVVNNYCFIMGTFTVDRLHEKQVGVQVPHPGVGPPEPDDELTFHSYYQWVPFVLFMQGILFYVPHWIWKTWEKGLFRAVIQNLSIRDYLGDNLGRYFKRDKEIKNLCLYVRYHRRNDKSWAYKFFFCEALYVVNVFCIFFFTDWFLGGQFLTYGSDVIQVAGMDPENRTDPMAFVFPRMAKCTFKSFGSSGTIQIRDVMCLIATNIINEKIFVYIWVWLVLLMTVSSLWMLYRLLTILLPFFRKFVLQTQVREPVRTDIARIMRGASVSEWYLLMTLCSNMENVVFSEFLREYANLVDRVAYLGDDDDVINGNLPKGEKGEDNGIWGVREDLSVE
ncbi:innexin inx2-like [Penaeus indicus]|uniref:innexin inx2-like n=1 Tax=Penaeus indicus TaxID=29960 RepID=UPI00300D7689